MPKTAVVLVNYRGAADTEACLQSLSHSQVPVISVVVDNTPNDPELQPVMEDFADAHFIVAPENLGFGKGNNLGIDWALANTDCGFVFVLNNDATVHPDTIGLLERAMGEHPEAGIVTGRIVLAEDPSVLWYGGGEVNWKRGGGRVINGKATDCSLAEVSRQVTFASGCAMLLRRSVLEQEKGFDRRFFMYEEDVELSLRVQEGGWTIWYASEASIVHLGQGSQSNRTRFIPRFDPRNPNLNFLVYQGVKNCLLNMGMHAKGGQKKEFLRHYPAFLLMKCMQWLFWGRFGAVRATLRAVSDFRKER